MPWTVYEFSDGQHGTGLAAFLGQSSELFGFTWLAECVEKRGRADKPHGFTVQNHNANYSNVAIAGPDTLHSAMYNFTKSDWSIEATDRKRERLARISDEELLSGMESAHRMCSPGSYWGERPRQAYVIQRELVRLEICKRGARLPRLVL